MLLEQGKVQGVRVQQEVLPAQVVVSNMDVINTYRKLLPAHRVPRHVMQAEKSSSALIFYWGMNRQFPQLDVHNIFFAKDYRQEFEHLFRHQQLWHDPTVYVYISAKMHAADAPAGAENWFVMVNAPHRGGQDWPQLIRQARQHILQKLERMLGQPLEPHITTEHILDPLQLESRTSSYLGSLYGNSSNSRLSAFLRHPNFSSRIKGLYFCGGSVHPGGGIPLCLLSGKIVADLVERDGTL